MKVARFSPPEPERSEMRHFIMTRAFVLGAVMILTSGLPETAGAQSVWQKVKDAAKQAGQKSQQQQQPQQSGQPQPQRGQTSGRGPQGGASINDSAGFQPPAGTKIEQTVLAPVQQGATFE